MFGSSPANQRIDAWWSFYRRNHSTWWINYFKDLIKRDLFHPGNQLEEEAVWDCFSGILQEDLDLVREHWNTHRIRDSKYYTVLGRPDELFLLPECSGGIQFLKISDLLCQIICYSLKRKSMNFRSILTMLWLITTLVCLKTGERQSACIFS